MLLGLSIFVTLAAVYVFLIILQKVTLGHSFGMLLGAILVLILGVVDDIRNLSVVPKLLGQIIVAVVTVAFGIRTTISYAPAWLNMLITVIWIIALINAFNLLDIMDGLCTGISFIIALTFLAESVFVNSGTSTLFFLMLSGVLLGAVIYNFPDAKLYLGDSGSMLLGFIFACSALNISYASSRSEGFALIVPILIVGLPLYDTAHTMLVRFKRRVPIMQKSKDHLALIIQGKAMGVKKTLCFMYLLCLIFSISALLVQILSSRQVVWAVLIIALLPIVVVLLTIRVKNDNNNKRYNQI